MKLVRGLNHFKLFSFHFDLFPFHILSPSNGQFPLCFLKALVIQNKKTFSFGIRLLQAGATGLEIPRSDAQGFGTWVVEMEASSFELRTFHFWIVLRNMN